VSRTFLALDESQTPPVACAIKQLKQLWGDRLPSNHPEPDNLSLPEISQEIHQEIQTLTQLGTHPQIPTFLEGFSQDGFLYLVQEYIAGDNLAIVLAERGTFSPAEVWEVLIGLLPVLAFVHDRGAIHRDIKPENIILRGQEMTAGNLVLVDFSVTQLLARTSKIAIGNPEYSAPEQVRGQPIFASDLYSLGVTCLHLLTGVQPFNLFDVDRQQWVWRDYRSLDNNPENLELLDLAEILDKSIDPDPSKRFASSKEAIAAIPKNIRQKIEILPPIPSPIWQCYATLSGHNGLFASVNAVAIAPDGKILASGSDDRTVRLWNVQTGKEIGILSGHEKPVRTVAFHPHTANILASGGCDRTIRIWDVAERQLIRTWIGHRHQVNAIAFSPDGSILASGSADKTIKLWEFETGNPIATLSGHALSVHAVIFSPSHSILVSASADSTVKVWDLTQFALIRTLSAHTAAAIAIAFSPDGQTLATGGEDRTIQLWDADAWKLILTLSGHPWCVAAIAFARDGNTLFSGSWDKTVKVWDVATGKELTVLTGHIDSVTCLAIAPSDRILASGSKDKTLKLWEFG
jgi:WD40 repeat protein